MSFFLAEPTWLSCPCV